MASILAKLPKPKHVADSLSGYKAPSAPIADPLGLSTVKEPPPYGKRKGYIPRR